MRGMSAERVLQATELRCSDRDAPTAEPLFKDEEWFSGWQRAVERAKGWAK
jgi:hypothetical protein